MTKIVNIKLALPIVSPLLDTIRATAADTSDAPAAGPQLWQQADIETRTLLGLFDGEFTSTGTINIRTVDNVAVMRAATWLRHRLRKTLLSSIADEDLQGMKDAEQYPGELRHAMLCYLFLATLQELTLKNFPAESYEPMTWLFAPFDWLKRSKKKNSEASPSADESEPWQVIVSNDPVNLMTYVTYVFQRELRMTYADAQRCMREVHETGQSVVWRGPQAAAEAHAQTLRAWHLQSTADAVR